MYRVPKNVSCVAYFCFRRHVIMLDKICHYILLLNPYYYSRSAHLIQCYIFYTAM
jgi:hypothetical protein